LGKPGGLGGRAFSDANFAINISNAKRFKNIATTKMSYDEWVPIFQFLNKKRLSLQEFENLGMRALDIKKAATPSVARKRSRFDDIINSLPDVGLLYSEMDTVDPVFWTEVPDSSLPLMK